MNTTTPAALQIHTQGRLAALALAGVMTAAIVLGANGLTTSAATPALLAQHQAQQQPLQPA